MLVGHSDQLQVQKSVQFFIRINFSSACVSIQPMSGMFYCAFLERRSSSVNIKTRLQDERPGFDSRYELGIISPHHLDQNESSGYRGLEQPGREADFSPPSSTEVKNAWSCAFTPLTTSSCRGS
jgi:hypothetical protein